jgi:hypothetical protein
MSAFLIKADFSGALRSAWWWQRWHIEGAGRLPREVQVRAEWFKSRASTLFRLDLEQMTSLKLFSGTPPLASLARSCPSP